MSEEVDHRNNHERKREIPFHTPAKSQKLEGKKRQLVLIQKRETGREGGGWGMRFRFR